MRSVAFLLLALAATPALAIPVEDRRFIENGERAWGNAFVSGDTAIVDRLLASDFVGARKGGASYDKKAILGQLRAGPSLTRNSTTILKIRAAEGVVVVDGRDDCVTTDKAHRSYAWTDVWSHRSGRWQIVSAQDAHLTNP